MQIQNSNGSLFILNGGQQPSFMCQTSNQYAHHGHLPNRNNKTAADIGAAQDTDGNLIPKLEALDSSSASIQYTTKMSNAGDGNTFVNVNYHTQSTILKGTGTIDLQSTDSMAFFNETLELSQEDIQKTLSANMPLNASTSANGRTSTHPNGASIQETILRQSDDDRTATALNPMDFIDNCDGGQINTVQAAVHDDDDVFVNLDAFDMFVEFPELDLDGKSSLTCTTDNTIIDMVGDDVNGSIRNNNNGNEPNAGNVGLSMTLPSSVQYVNQLNETDSRNDLFNISDFSPEWAYPEGGIKVLVTGPWDHANSNYTVLFDSFPVPTTIVQSGVLRCYCPAHEVGLVTLQVACDGYVISNSCIFEYKSPANAENGATCDVTPNVTNNGESVFKFTLFNRLESIEERMQIKMEPSDSVCVFFLGCDGTKAI